MTVNLVLVSVIDDLITANIICKITIKRKIEKPRQNDEI
jgi:hypothetical protein